MRKTPKTQVLLLLILLNGNLFGLSVGDEYNESDYEYDIGGDPIGYAPTTTTTANPIFAKPCRSMINEFCVKLNQCATGIRTPKLNIDLNKPRGECHYLETCCERSKIIESSPPLDVDLTHDQCGITNEDGLYMTVQSKNQETSFAQYPWVVAILDSESKHICNGVLISHTVVLSAANCLTLNGNLTVSGGDWDLLSTNEIVPHENRLVKDIIIHKKYVSTTLKNNLVLLILESAFSRTRHIVPICMFHDLGSSKLNTTRCFATGWKINKYSMSDPKENIVLKLDIPTKTAAINGRDAMIKSRVIPYPYRNLKGAPLVCPTERNQYFLLGIWSYQENGNYVVFEKIVRNLKWIKDYL
nr:phenoloxidase-activating factor 2-like [Drosophila bipectinata]